MYVSIFVCFVITQAGSRESRQGCGLGTPPQLLFFTCIRQYLQSIMNTDLARIAQKWWNEMNVDTLYGLVSDLG